MLHNGWVVLVGVDGSYYSDNSWYYYQRKCTHDVSMKGWGESCGQIRVREGGHRRFDRTAIPNLSEIPDLVNIPSSNAGPRIRISPLMVVSHTNSSTITLPNATVLHDKVDIPQSPTVLSRIRTQSNDISPVPLGKPAEAEAAQVPAARLPAANHASLQDILDGDARLDHELHLTSALPVRKGARVAAGRQPHAQLVRAPRPARDGPESLASQQALECGQCRHEDALFLSHLRQQLIRGLGDVLERRHARPQRHGRALHGPGVASDGQGGAPGLEHDLGDLVLGEKQHGRVGVRGREQHRARVRVLLRGREAHDLAAIVGVELDDIG